MSEAVSHRVGLARGAYADVPPHDDWLTAAERAVLERLRLEKRRLDWRLGRWCAKRVLHAWSELPFAGIEILADHDGAPVARGAVPMPVLSISHRGGHGLAAIADPLLRLGCDVELVEPRSERFIRDFLTAAESAHVLAVHGGERDLLANLCWAAKECVVKALRTGLRADTRSVHVKLPPHGSRGEEWQPIEAESASGGRFTGCWRLVDGRVEVVLADRQRGSLELQSVS
jgi:4'-phosphopantetheinyl transferase